MEMLVKDDMEEDDDDDILARTVLKEPPTMELIEHPLPAEPRIPAQTTCLIIPQPPLQPASTTGGTCRNRSRSNNKMPKKVKLEDSDREERECRFRALQPSLLKTDQNHHMWTVSLGAR